VRINDTVKNQRYGHFFYYYIDFNWLNINTMAKFDPEEEKRMAQASDFYTRNPYVKKSAIAH
jgi:hypothetical protein